MSTVNELPQYAGDQPVSEDSFEKKSVNDDAEVITEKKLEDVEAFEERLAHDEAADEEYLVQNAHDVAIKVLSTRDDPTLQAVTFRTVFLGLGFSAFGAYVYHY